MTGFVAQRQDMIALRGNSSRALHHYPALRDGSTSNTIQETKDEVPSSISNAGPLAQDIREEDRKFLDDLGFSQQIASRTLGMPDLIELHQPFATADFAPKKILSSEITRAKPSLGALGIGFSVSYAKKRMRGGRPKKPPYFACCYNVGNLGDVNIVAFFYPLISDWDLMEKKSNEYRQRVRSGIREEMIHSVQVITVKSRYERSTELLSRFRDAETYYEYLLGKIVEELATNKEGQELVLTAAKLYYEDWTITSMEKLREMDKKLHGRDGYLISELIRQLVQIRIGELTSEEAKGTAWDKNRIFYVGRFGTTENLLKAMAGTLRQAAPKLVDLSPTLAESLVEIERTIQKIQLAQSKLLESPTLKDDLGHRERVRKVS